MCRTNTQYALDSALRRLLPFLEELAAAEVVEVLLDHQRSGWAYISGDKHAAPAGAALSANRAVVALWPRDRRDDAVLWKTVRQLPQDWPALDEWLLGKV